MSKALKRVEVLLSHWGGNKTVVVSVADLREVARLAQVGRAHQRLADDANERIGLSRAPVSTANRGRKR